MKHWRMTVLIALAVAMLGTTLWLSPHCDASSPVGPTLGAVFKLGGC